MDWNEGELADGKVDSHQFCRPIQELSRQAEKVEEGGLRKVAARGSLFGPVPHSISLAYLLVKL
ncbi:hypothetical protein D3C73_1596260 [compost metagenome]